MTKIFKQHPAAGYFIVVLLIAAGSIVIISAFTGLPAPTAEKDRLFPLAVSILLFSPLLSGVFMTIVLDGFKGLKHYFGQIRAVKRHVTWYLLVFFFAPLLVFGLLSVLMQFSPEYRPAIFTTDNIVSTLLIGLAIGFFGGGLFEEFGWTGFALPKLRKKYGSLTSGIILGFVWGVWHVPVTYFACGDVNGNLDPDAFTPTIVFYMLVLPVYRILMVYVYDYTKSLPISMIMHAVLSASTVFIFLPKAQGNALSLYYLILFGILVILAGICYILISKSDKQKLLPDKNYSR